MKYLNRMELLVKKTESQYTTHYSYYETLEEWADNIHNGDDLFGVKMTNEVISSAWHQIFKNERVNENVIKSSGTEYSIDDVITEFYKFYTNPMNKFYWKVPRDIAFIETSCTGHTHYNSPYETDNTCGNCDGARCNTCKTRYKVVNVTDELLYSGFDRDEAEKIRNENTLHEEAELAINEILEFTDKTEDDIRMEYDKERPDKCKTYNELTPYHKFRAVAKITGACIIV